MSETVEERGRHFGVDENAWPFAEGEIGGDDHRGPLVEPADEMEKQLSAGLSEREIAKLVENDKIHPCEIIRHAALAPDDRRAVERNRALFLKTLGVPRWKLPMIALYVRTKMAADVDQISLFPGAGEMIEELAAALCNSGVCTDIDSLVSALREREEIMSTGIGFGIGIPHASTDLVSDLTAVFARSRSGVDLSG
mgnify:CR=1 FL=1